MQLNSMSLTGETEVEQKGQKCSLGTLCVSTGICLFILKERKGREGDDRSGLLMWHHGDYTYCTPLALACIGQSL